MVASQKNIMEMFAYMLTVLFVVALAGKFGKQWLEWLLQKLYEYWIQRYH
jgi:hypothetical protein